MKSLSELEQTQSRLRDVIINTCNKIGCDNCGLSWTENGKEKCSATELQSKEMDLMHKTSTELK